MDEIPSVVMLHSNSVKQRATTCVWTIGQGIGKGQRLGSRRYRLEYCTRELVLRQDGEVIAGGLMQTKE